MAICLLIVDDSPAMRWLTRRVAQISGLGVDRFLEASDGEEALALLGRENVDAILTDIHMPRMDGEEFVTKLEADRLLRLIPVLVISTDSTAARMEKLRSLGAKGYLRKPFTPLELRGELEKVLGGLDV